MPDTDLHTGAERLAEEIEARKLCYPPADAIAADPGVVALVRYADLMSHGPMPSEQARAALRAWVKGVRDE